ncbi:MAG: hypothetical protein AAF889_12540 [Cyanobacteria bacterium P01_D01_bin.73]
MKTTLKNAIQEAISEKAPLQLGIERLPLAVYREVLAHLQQLEGVDVTLITQDSQEFDYLQSQVGGIKLLPESASNTDIQNSVGNNAGVGDRLVDILEHYANRFGPWIIIE